MTEKEIILKVFDLLEKAQVIYFDKHNYLEKLTNLAFNDEYQKLIELRDETNKKISKIYEEKTLY